MTDNKLTDNEIKKTCKNCLHYKACVNIYSKSFRNADMDLIELVSNRENDCENFIDKDLTNRLQAENERLQFELTKSKYAKFLGDYEHIKNEAYKECIEKVKKLIQGWNDLEYYSEVIKAETDLDNLLKELVGDK